jgi:CRP-like cAMP-binding protein
VEPHKTGTESAPDLEEAAFEKFLADLPLATYSAGEAVITAGSKSGRLLILKKGAVAILMGSTEIARVTEPGAVLGEISALLGRVLINSVHVRFAPKATHIVWRRNMSRWAMCGRLRVGKNFLHVSSIGRCGHVFGLLARFT